MVDNTKETASKTSQKIERVVVDKSSNQAKSGLSDKGTATMPSTATVAPVPRIQQIERCDDPLACLAMLSKKSLEEVTALAHEAGFPRQGPAYIPDEMLVVLAMKSGGWVAKNYKEFTSFSQLPSIAILHVDYSEAIDLGRTVLWLKPPLPEGLQENKAPALAPIDSDTPLASHPSSSAGSASLFDLGSGYVIDPAYWIEPEQQILTGVTPVHFQPWWYMELHLTSAKTDPNKKAG